MSLPISGFVCVLLFEVSDFDRVDAILRSVRTVEYLFTRSTQVDSPDWTCIDARESAPGAAPFCGVIILHYQRNFSKNVNTLI